MNPEPDHRPAQSTTAEINAATIGGARRHGGPIVLCEYDPAWPKLFEREATRIRQALGATVVGLEHVGSTSVPSLAAKPIIDMLLVVPDSSDESAYVAPLESAGYQLRIREPQWFEHRMFKGPDTDINLHVFSTECTEIARMLRFRDHLRRNVVDRQLYEAKKRELAARDWEFVQNYADAKTEVIAQIAARADALER